MFKMESKKNFSYIIDDVNFDDFNLTIIINEKNIYSACLFYQGNDLDFINEVKKIKKNEDEDEEEDLCLIQVIFGIAPFDKLEVEFEIMDKEENAIDNISFRIPSNAHLFAYYNNIRKYNLQKFEQTKKLKGVVHIIFCIILAHALEEKLISLEGNVTVEASGSMMKSEEEIKNETESSVKDMIGLVKHYETLGFKQSLPKHLTLALQNNNVPMQGKVKDILQVCAKNSESRVKAIEKIKGNKKRKFIE